MRTVTPSFTKDNGSQSAVYGSEEAKQEQSHQALHLSAGYTADALRCGFSSILPTLVCCVRLFPWTICTFYLHFCECIYDIKYQ